MLAVLIEGTTDPEVLGRPPKGRLRAKIPVLREALEGRFDQLHAVWVGRSSLTSISSTSRSPPSRRRSRSRSPLSPQRVELLRSIPGVQRRSAEVIVAEIGTDMSRSPRPSTW